MKTHKHSSATRAEGGKGHFLVILHFSQDKHPALEN